MLAKRDIIVLLLNAALLACAIAAGVFSAGSTDWDPALLTLLLGAVIVGELTALPATGTRITISGSFLALVMAMVFIGATGAALLGVAGTIAAWFRWRERPHVLLSNLAAYAAFPLAAGLAFEAAREGLVVDSSEPLFYGLVFGAFWIAVALNFVMVASFQANDTRTTFGEMFRRVGVPSLPSQLVASLLAVAFALLYVQIGLLAIALFAFGLFTYQHLTGRLLLSEERREELERRTKQLASFQVGLLSALLRTLDLRDRMTARHSAAVARYAREIASAAGLSEEEQELVHTAGLLHDIGKFIFPDHILKADVPLTDEDWNIIRTHPYQGARIVSQVDGYGPVGEIILAHHERMDGKGYPRGLEGEEIPILSRIISVADVYDVITARDSYREPVSSFEAIQELRRVAGTQLDAHLVNVFVELLAGRDVRYRHGEDADFDAELALEKRVHAYAAPRDDAPLPGDTRREDADAGAPAVETGPDQAPAQRHPGA